MNTKNRPQASRTIRRALAPIILSLALSACVAAQPASPTEPSTPISCEDEPQSQKLAHNDTAASCLEPTHDNENWVQPWQVENFG